MLDPFDLIRVTQLMNAELFMFMSIFYADLSLSDIRILSLREPDEGRLIERT